MTEKDKIKTVIIKAINDNAEALEALRRGDDLICENERLPYRMYLLGRRVALFECYYFIVEGWSNGKN